MITLQRHHPAATIAGHPITLVPTGQGSDSMFPEAYMLSGVVTDPTARLAFALAGNATFTVLNPQTGKRFTYKIKRGKKADAPHFVSVLTGPDNEHDYEFIGTIFDRQRFHPSRRSSVPRTAPSVAAFAWIWTRMAALGDIAPAVFYHEGRCGRCGRLLTVPESLESGIGPECAKKVSKGA